MGNKISLNRNIMSQELNINKTRSKLYKARGILRRRYYKLKNIENLLKNSPNSIETRRMIKLKLLQIIKLLEKQQKNVTFCKRYYNNINEFEKSGNILKIDENLILLYKCLQKKTLQKKTVSKKKKTKKTKRQSFSLV